MEIRKIIKDPCKGWFKFFRSFGIDFIWAFILLIKNIAQYLFEKYKRLCQEWPLAVNELQLILFSAGLILIPASKNYKNKINNGTEF